MKYKLWIYAGATQVPKNHREANARRETTQRSELSTSESQLQQIQETSVLANSRTIWKLEVVYVACCMMPAIP